MRHTEISLLADRLSTGEMWETESLTSLSLYDIRYYHFFWAIGLLLPLILVSHLLEYNIFFFSNNPSNLSDIADRSIRAPHRLSECSFRSWFNCHITSASAAVVLNPVLKPLINVSLHSDCWLTRLRLLASKQFPFPVTPCSIFLSSSYLSLKL